MCEQTIKFGDYSLKTTTWGTATKAAFFLFSRIAAAIITRDA